MQLIMQTVQAQAVCPAPASTGRAFTRAAPAPRHDGRGLPVRNFIIFNFIPPLNLERPGHTIRRLLAN